MLNKFKFLLLSFFLAQITYAQIIRTESPDTISHWKKLNKVGVTFTQITFHNWSAGGNNSISAIANGNFSRNYLRGNFKFDNELLLRYGLNKQEGQELRKTDDQINFSSTFGYRRDTVSNWFHGGKFNFLTQFANGYKYPNTEKKISTFFSPAYIFLGIGSEYSRKDLGFNMYISPATLKSTMVLDRNLANEGAFGVEKATYNANGDIITRGKRNKTEFGALLNAAYKHDIMKNINLNTRILMYTDYLKDFGNIDIDWQTDIEMTINKYVKANVGIYLLYDDNIATKVEENGVTLIKGPSIQLKQIVGVGLTYIF